VRAPKHNIWAPFAFSKTDGVHVETSRLIIQSRPTRSAFVPLIVRGVLTHIAEWRRTRRAERELLALDERLLKDIGLNRAEIPAAVRGEPHRLYELDRTNEL
jgi:uncharacterized protein YjiS (DUF1127 family)